MDQPCKDWRSDKEISVVKDEPVSTALKGNPADETTSSSNQKPVIQTPKSLNPFAPEIEASPYQRCEPYFPVDYQPNGQRRNQEVKQTSDSSHKATVEDRLSRLADIPSH